MTKECDMQPTMRITNHPILGAAQNGKSVRITINGTTISAIEGEPIAAALLANGIRICRQTEKKNEPRGIFCAIGQCTDCMMTVDGVPNIRTCVTPAHEGMRIETSKGIEKGGKFDD